MPAIINKADARKTVRDASDDMEKAGTNSAAADGQTAHDASEPVATLSVMTGGQQSRRDPEERRGRETESPESSGRPARHDGTLGKSDHRCR